MSETLHYHKDPRWLELTEALLNQLRGRIRLLQPDEERRQLVAAALDTVLQSTNGEFPHPESEHTRQEFLRAFLSYGIIEELLNDPSVEDIIINGTEQVFVHRTGLGLVKTSHRFETQQEITIFAKKLVVFAGRSELDPINDVELADIRGRVNIIASPFGPQITITRAKTQPFTILQLVDSGLLTDELAAQLWLYVEGLRVRPANLIISGGSGAGKTTLLNALLSFIPWGDRVVTIEDTLELNTAFLENCARLESSRRVRMPDLVKNSLRMRSDRILIGEVRGEEARDLMTTMNLGKCCMGTLHASSARETILRLQNEPMNVPPTLVNLVDVFVILRKLNVDGKLSRVVYELVETAGMEQHIVLLSPIWNYDYDRRMMVECSPSSRYRDHLATESGRTPPQIMEEVALRARVLRRMHDSGEFPDMLSVTRFCQRFSETPEQALRELGLKSTDRH